MDEAMRTLWCGNLSEKVTEEILYELFLQGGPVQNVTIPKHPNGKQRSFGFVVYKHVSSVSYALELFDGTSLYNRPLNIGLKKNIEMSQVAQPPDHFIDFNHWLQLGEEVLLGNNMSHLKGDIFEMNMMPTLDSPTKQTDNYSYKNDRRSRRVHPYNKEQHKSSNHHRRSHYSKHGYRSRRHNY